MGEISNLCFPHSISCDKSIIPESGINCKNPLPCFETRNPDLLNELKG